ncbi:hypothetical protein CY34DRAFT_106179 [Suillus luteus UH-Slu-Lm8-n1]|uniref:Uncharacterized protein n=1 Tax=Suillus luteus UH-Slu-Lm8-n1 TaxID=930992 RepID=A0A0D0B203_9AGAM|nr:hypothetical protein CY34DRAFT_106179 [Suillus luteus UH-Slu-Lm8-n1]
MILENAQAPAVQADVVGVSLPRREGHGCHRRLACERGGMNEVLEQKARAATVGMRELRDLPKSAKDNVSTPMAAVRIKSFREPVVWYLQLVGCFSPIKADVDLVEFDFRAMSTKEHCKTWEATHRL